jgi:small subunit ribosomal protein S17
MAEKDEQNEIEETEAAEPAEAPVEAETPVAAEETVAAEAAAAEPAGKSKKRLPRALRPKRTRPTRAAKQPGTRKPLSREPKPETERGARQERRGVVVSSAMDKTIVVRVEIIKVHPRYKKVIRRSTKFHAHDERNEAKVGDVVRIVETRPVSRTKRWRLAEVVEAAR